MRKLLNTLFVTSEDVYLALENENVIVLAGEERKGQFPLIMLEGIISFSYKGASPALMGACARRGVELSFMTPNGRFLARVCGEERGNVLLRKKQYRISDSPEESCRIARCMIFGKTYNSRWVLERAIRDHAMRIDVDKMKEASGLLAASLEPILNQTDLDALRGIEGQNAAAYFGRFDDLILNQKDVFHYEERSRRPPMDRVNAMLSFVYTLLTNDCAAALEAVGLDAYVGFLHRDRPGRVSLALDLMEELRAVFADRLVLTLINTKAVRREHFVRQESGAVLLNDAGRKVVLSAWQSRKREEITHPYLKEKMYWGLVPYVQALLLSRALRGDLDDYPAFLWK
ncbi:MAG: type I-C CRISPR-associated endonuclease Cas1c [Clostridia bacterium]|nr:type I-C CRISPR-associated endonuclease Cas1c [Clostridia bacterium]